MQLQPVSAEITEIQKYMGEFFELAPGERCLGFFYMGYYQKAPVAGERDSIENKTEWIS